MAQAFQTNLINVATNYINYLKIPVTNTTLRENLLQNPYFPSLYCLSNVFDKLNISNQAFLVNEEDLAKIEPPFLTYCSDQNTGNDFVLVTSVTNEFVSYIAEGSKSKKISRQQFLSQWQKQVFVAESNDYSGERNYRVKFKSEKLKQKKQILLYCACAILMVITAASLFDNSDNSLALSAASILLIKILGITGAGLLLIYEIDKSNTFIKKICTANKQTNCDAVLNSKAGKLFGISWVELGFFYFSSSFIFLLFPGVAFVSKVPLLIVSSSLVALYVPFSIYYQWRIIKQWCPLCLFIQLVLTMELIWAMTNYFTHNQSLVIFSQLLPVWNAIIVSLALPVVVWYLIKSKLVAANDSSHFDAAYKRLLYNPEIFNSLLQLQPSVPDGWQNLGIDIGNPDATNTIIKVCSPYCGPCSNAHIVLEDIIKRNKSVKLKVIFFLSSSDEANTVNKPVKLLLAIASKGNLKLTEEALDAWYLPKKKDYNIFSTKFPMNGELKLQNEKIDRMKDWCLAADIIGTPTIFINGKKLPQTYNIDELKYLI